MPKNLRPSYRNLLNNKWEKRERRRAEAVERPTVWSAEIKPQEYFTFTTTAPTTEYFYDSITYLAARRGISEILRVQPTLGTTNIGPRIRISDLVIEDEVTMAPPMKESRDPPSPYDAPAGSFRSSYIGVCVGDDVCYWCTDGNLSPPHMARMLSRYYRTPEQVAKLFRTGRIPANTADDDTRAATMLRPDGRNMYGGRTTWMTYTQFSDGTLSLAGRCVLWDGYNWYMREGRSEPPWKLIDQHDDSE